MFSLRSASSRRVWRAIGWTTFLLLATSLLNHPRTPADDQQLVPEATIRFWTHSILRHGDGTFHSKVLPYNVEPVTEESWEEASLWWWTPGSGVEGFSANVFLLREKRGHTVSPPVEVRGHVLHGNFRYVTRNPPKEVVIRGTSRTREIVAKSRLSAPGDYFRHLHTPQSSCRKLVMIGGTLACSNTNNSSPEDGNKLVCLDPSLELPGGRNPKSCLVFSFGISNDATFDEGAILMRCEVHMFDIAPTPPLDLLKRTRHAHFHQMGLRDEHMIAYVQNANKTIEFNNVQGFLQDLHLIGSPLHVLKIDIEETEWSILRRLANDTILDIVGQIVIEVHMMNLLSVAEEKQLEFMQERYEILRTIEARGFRLVSYWDNPQPMLAYTDSQGRRYDTCGEALYVNTKWYDPAFKTKLKNIGFSFRV